MAPDDGQLADELEHTRGVPRVARVAAVGVVLAALVVVGVVARTTHHHHASAGASSSAPVAAHLPAPIPAAPVTPVASVGSVLMSVLPACVRTDHHSTLQVAMALTNLTNYPLRVVSASSSDDGLHVTELRVGARPCASAPNTDVKVPPGGDTVVALRFAVATPCPAPARLVATLTMDAAGRAVHAETPTLGDLAALRFPGC